MWHHPKVHAQDDHNDVCANLQNSSSPCVTTATFSIYTHIYAWPSKSQTVFLNAGWLSIKHCQVGKATFNNNDSSCVQITAAAAAVVVLLLALLVLPPGHEQLAHPAFGPV